LNPTITVAIPVYNDAHVVNRAITSALNQSLLPFEVMIVDDGSEDDLEGLISKYKHPVLRYLRKEHSGLAKTRNFAVNHSRGEYIAFLDADDAYMPTYMEEVTSAIKQFKPDMVYTAYRLCKREGDLLQERYIGMNGGDTIYERLLCFGNFICISTVTAKVDTLKALGGFYEHLRVNCGCEDWDMWIRLSKNGYLHFVNKILVEKIFNHRGPYKREKRLYRLDNREVVGRGLNLDSNSANTYRNRAFSNLYYLWARIEMEDKHFFNVALFLLLGTLHYPLFPFRLARRIVRLQAVKRGLIQFSDF
jgi:glycosyltransferase involved in cell wall biosynthesis